MDSSLLNCCDTTFFNNLFIKLQWNILRKLLILPAVKRTRSHESFSWCNMDYKVLVWSMVFAACLQTSVLIPSLSNSVMHRTPKLWALFLHWMFSVEWSFCSFETILIFVHGYNLEKILQFPFSDFVGWCSDMALVSSKWIHSCGVFKSIWETICFHRKTAVTKHMLS